MTNGINDVKTKEFLLIKHVIDDQSKKRKPNQTRDPKLAFLLEFIRLYFVIRAYMPIISRPLVTKDFMVKINRKTRLLWCSPVKHTALSRQ